MFYPALVYGVLIAALASGIACRLLMVAGLVDPPNEARKAHRSPTPTSGGVGMALGFALGMITATLVAGPEWRVSADGVERITHIAEATGFACAFMALGFIDDAWPLSPKLKFLVFALLSVVAVLTAGVVTYMPLGGDYGVQFGFWVGLIGSALFVFTLVNSVNFIDGANGLAMGSVAIGLIAIGVIAIMNGAPVVPAFAFCGAAAMGGFLVWNFPKGKLFAGDSGALFAGAIAAMASLLAVNNAGVSPLIPPVVFFPILADVLLTLAYRVANKRKILVGHAEHMYQIGMRSGLKHAKISRLFWALMAACGIVGIIAAELDMEGGDGSYAPLVALAGLALISLVVSAGVRKFARRKGLTSEV